MAGSSLDNIPYSAEAANLTPEAFALEQVIELGVEAALLECRVAMPAQVTRKYDDQTVDVQPAFRTRFWGRDPEDLPELPRVPIAMPSGADYRIALPVQVGDTGYCLVMDRRLDAWLAGTGGTADPQDSRAHDLSDAIFIPGLVPTRAHTTDVGTDLVLQNGQLTVRLQKAGRIRVANQTQELIDLLLQAMQAQIDTLSALAQAQTIGAFGLSPFTVAVITQLTQLGATVSTIKQNLTTLKG